MVPEDLSVENYDTDSPEIIETKRGEPEESIEQMLDRIPSRTSELTIKQGKELREQAHEENEEEVQVFLILTNLSQLLFLDVLGIRRISFSN